jgi:hypothetical protein
MISLSLYKRVNEMPAPSDIKPPAVNVDDEKMGSLAMAEKSPNSKFRFRLLVGVLMMLIGIYLFVPLVEKWTDNRRKLEKVKVGMTVEDVEAILGGPGGPYSNSSQTAMEVTDPRDQYLYWHFNDGKAEVVMRDGKVNDFTWYPNESRSLRQFINDMLRKFGL